MTFVDRRRHRARRRHLAVAARVRRLDPPITAAAAARPHLGRARQPVPGRRHRARRRACARSRRHHASSPPARRSRTATRPSSSSAGSSRCWAAPTSPPSCDERLTGPLGDGRHHVAGRAVGAQPRVRRARDGRRLREAARHDPPRRRGERHARAVVECSSPDRLQPGRGVRHDRTTTPSASRRSPATASAAGPTWRTAGTTTVVSGNGGKGLYPWVDFTTRTWGIVGVQDDARRAVRGPGVAAGRGRGAHRGHPVKDPGGMQDRQESVSQRGDRRRRCEDPGAGRRPVEVPARSTGWARTANACDHRRRGVRHRCRPTSTVPSETVDRRRPESTVSRRWMPDPGPRRSPASLWSSAPALRTVLCHGRGRPRRGTTGSRRDDTRRRDDDRPRAPPRRRGRTAASNAGAPRAGASGSGTR